MLSYNCSAHPSIEEKNSRVRMPVDSSDMHQCTPVLITIIDRGFELVYQEVNQPEKVC